VATAAEEEEDSVVVVLVVAVVDTPEAGVEVDRVEAELVAAEVESASVDPDSVVVRVIIIAEACALLIRAPGSCVLRFIGRPPLPGRIAGSAIQWRVNPEHPGGPHSIEE
jgi:hypothetical protein